MGWFIVFWISLMVIAYAYAGYPLLLKILGKKYPDHLLVPAAALPELTLLIAAYNEAQWMEAKLRNALSLSYPAGKLRILVVDDGSTDQTATIARRFEAVQVISHPFRKGKSSALNTGMAHIHTPVTVFTDANAIMQNDCLLRMIPLLEDAATGGVSGRKLLRPPHAKGDAAAAEADYWQYESWLKQLESSFYTLAGATGEIFAIRTHLYQQVPEAMITDDFFISMTLQEQGTKVQYAHDAVAAEYSSLSLFDEWKRKVRISAGAFQSLPLYLHHLNPFRDFRFAFQFFSHRILRWVFCAPALILLWFAGFQLAHSGSAFYLYFFGGQLLVCKLATLRLLFYRHSFPAVVNLPFYFLFMHAAVVAGFFLWITGKQSVLWNKANR